MVSSGDDSCRLLSKLQNASSGQLSPQESVLNDQILSDNAVQVSVSGLPETGAYCNIPTWVLQLAERQEKLYQIKNHPVEIVRGLIMDAIRETVESAEANPLLTGLQDAETGGSIVRHYTCADLVAGKVDIVGEQPDRLPDPWTTPSLCYDKLRMSPSHPPRSPSDTYYRRHETETNGELHMLRTQTSAHQMELLQSMGQLLEKGVVGGEGCAITLTGDVYRKDEIDATHHVVHHQMEGLRLRKVQVGPEDVDLEHAWRRAKYEVDRELRALLEGVMRYVYCGLMRESSGQGQDVASSIQEWEDLLQQAQNDLVSGRTTNHTVEKHLQEAADVADIKMLYRPHLIPYVSPGYEMDIKVQDGSCSGNSSKWLEVLGCGVIHDEVLRNAGLDPQQYVGWAYGIGLERVAMRLLGIPDIRRMWELQNPNLLEQGAKMRRIIREAMTGESWVAAWKSGALSGEKLRWNDLPYSQYPPVTRAMTIRLPDLMKGSSIHMLTCWNDVYELLNTIIKESEKTTDLYIESVTEKVQDWESYYSDNWSAAKKERYLARKALAESGLLKTLEIRCRSQDRTLRGEEVEALLQEISQEVERRGGYIQ